MNKKLILILTEPRSGSNFLSEVLNYYSLWPVGEFLLNPKGFEHLENPTFPYEIVLNRYQLTKLFDFFEVEYGNYLELIKQINRRPIDAIFKLYESTEQSLVINIHDFQFKKFGIDVLLDLPYVEIIILQRSNRMARYISHLIAQETKIWYTVNTSDMQVTVDREDFIKSEQESKKWFDSIKQRVSSKEYLEVNYERDLENIDKEHFYKLFDPWFEKINLNATKKNYNLKLFKKQNKSKLQYSILNYTEIKDLI